MKTLREFEAEHKQSKKGKQDKIRNSWGVYDAYKLIRKNHWYNIGRPVTEKEFYYIIRGVNKLVAEELLKGNEIIFPASMGKLVLVKNEVGAFFENGKLKISYPIDWKETWKLWYEDEQAFKNKVLLRHNNQWVYKTHYNKYHATYDNKCFYQFKTNKQLKSALSDNIKQGKTDTLYGKRDKIYKH